MRAIKMKTLIVNRNTPELAENQKREIELMTARIPSLDNEIIIYNCDEEPFLGKLNGHYRALQEHRDERCDYYWFNHPDVSFDIDMDCLSKLLTIMEENSWVSVISPTEEDGLYPNMYKKGYKWHPVAACNYLSLLIRGTVIEKNGFMNPDFIYCWGAVHEYSYKAYKSGWCTAYCDIAKMRHFGGTTYGKKDTISRKVYRQNACEFARHYFIENYGKNWDKEFAKMLPNGVLNTYSIVKKYWGSPLFRLLFDVLKYPLKYALKYQLYDRFRLGGNKNMIRLYLGCGNRKRKGWVNIDVDEKVKPDIVADVKDLNMFEDEAVNEIECCHLFEHFTYLDAVDALKEWHRVLRRGGKLFLELPNLERCIEILYNKEGKEAENLAMIGLYGYNPDIEKQGIPMVHKYGWTPKTLSDELRKLGFREVKEVPITQKYRPAAKYNRDMRLECIK